MSIPLDRLYNYLDSQVDDNIIIYRFSPHGSKKLADLHMLCELSEFNWKKYMTTPQLFFHDQEPLNHNLYTNEEILNTCVERESHWEFLLKSPWLRKEVIHANMRGAIAKFNCYDKSLLCHSEKNSQEVDWYEQHDYIGVYWWSHAIIARDWFRYAEHDTTLKVNFDNITHDFLVYNRAWQGSREYRLKFSELVANANIITNCYMRFSEYEDNKHYLDHCFKNNSLSLTRNDLHLLYPKNTHQSSASADYNNEDYIRCGIEIVLETLFDDSRNHLTEKILRPIACGRPFILTGTAGSLQYLRDYGFKTFNGIINEHYDTLEDPLERLHAIIQEMQRITKLDTRTKKQLWQELYNIADYNRQLFFSDRWSQNIIDEFKTNIESGLELIKQHRTGRHLLECRIQAETDPYLATLNNDIPVRTMQDLYDVLEWLAQVNANK